MLRSMPKHEAEPYEPWLAKPPFRPRHVQRTMVFRGEWTPEFGDAEFSVYIRMGLIVEGDFSCGISYVATGGQSLVLARYDGKNHKHGEIAYRPHIHWLTPQSFDEVETPELEVDATDRFDTLQGAVYCLIYDFNLSDIHIPSHIRRMIQWH